MDATGRRGFFTWTDLRREPFRLFFPFGVACGLLGVGHWLWFAAGWAPTSSGFYHASLQVGSYMGCLIIGFLLTALPRFAATEPASSVELIVFLALAFAQPVLLSMGRWVWAEGCFAAVLVALAVFAGRRFAKRKAGVGPPPEFIWIGFAVLHGVVGTILMMMGQTHVGPSWLLLAGRPMVQQGFLLSIVLGVGGFMAPRLMGRAWIPAIPPASMESSLRRRRILRMVFHGVAGAALLVSFGMEGARRVAAAYRLRALLVSAELLWTTRFYLPPRSAELYVRLLWVSLWMLVLGLWGAALWLRYRIAMLHLMFLGGFSLMAFAVGAMVALSHTGEGRRLQQPLWSLRVVGAGIALAVVARVTADLRPSAFFLWLGVASVSWLIAAVSWLWLVLPAVVRTLPPGEFERMHDAAKRRVQPNG